jgi:hypothetical protein
VHGANLAGLVRQDPSGPQGVSQIVAPTLEFRGQPTVDRERRASEDVVDGDQIVGAQM